VPTAVQDITIKEGAKFIMVLHVKDSTGAVFSDLASYTGRAQVRAEQDVDSELLLTFAVAMDTPIAGDVQVTADADEDIPAGTRKFVEDGYYDVEIVETADTGNVLRLAQGRALADPNVTTP
jgi:hypothetical protein